MTLQEAIKSGKSFRRPLYGSYDCLDSSSSFTAEEVLATDWEIKEQSVKITKTNLKKAAETLFDKRQGITMWGDMEGYIELLCGELGL